MRCWWLRKKSIIVVWIVFWGLNGGCFYSTKYTYHKLNRKNNKESFSHNLLFTWKSLKYFPRQFSFWNIFLIFDKDLLFFVFYLYIEPQIYIFIIYNNLFPFFYWIFPQIWVTFFYFLFIFYFVKTNNKEIK